MGGKKHGKGVLNLSDGNSFEGEFLNNKLDGYGLYRSTDGSEFKG